MRAAALSVAASVIPKWARALTPELITEPVHFAAGTTTEDKLYVCDPNFVHDSSIAAAAAIDGNSTTVRRVAILSGFVNWQSRWDTFPEVAPPPGVRSSCSGFSSQRHEDIHLGGIKIHGFPQTGLIVSGCNDSTITDVEIHNCHNGMSVRGQTEALVNRLTATRVHVTDVWGPTLGNWGVGDAVESQIRPGEYSGRDGIIANGLRDCTFYQCSAVGETGNGSYKFGGDVKRLKLIEIQGANLQIQGSGGADPAAEPQSGSRDIEMLNCTLDKTFGYGSSQFNVNALTLAWNMENVNVRGCVFRTYNTNGHGCQMVEPNVEAYFEGNTFSGFNLVRGADDAHALHRNDGCTLNGGGTAGDADFISRNYFINQDRLVLVDG